MTVTVICNRTYILTRVDHGGVEIRDALGHLAGRVRLSADHDPVVIAAPRGWDADDRRKALDAAVTADAG